MTQVDVSQRPQPSASGAAPGGDEDTSSAEMPSCFGFSADDIFGAHPATALAAGTQVPEPRAEQSPAERAPGGSSAPRFDLSGVDLSRVLVEVRPTGASATPAMSWQLFIQVPAPVSPPPAQAPVSMPAMVTMPETAPFQPLVDQGLPTASRLALWARVPIRG